MDRAGVLAQNLKECINVGGRGGTSGFNNNMFKPISLYGMAGTDRQKSYAQDLLESMRRTAELNGVAGFHQQENGIRRYVANDDAEKVKQAYRIMKVVIENQKTYGDVIGILKNQSILSYADTLQNQAKRSGKSIKKYVDDFIEEVRKRKR